MAKVKWYGDEFLSKMTQQLESRMDVCAQHIADEAKQLMRDTPTSGEIIKIIRRNNNPTGRNYHTRASRSMPNNPPAVQQGNLLRSIDYERAGTLRRRVGTNLKYGLYLELGTRKMIKRPFLVPALKNSENFIEKQISAPMF